MTRTYYDVLGVEPDADRAAIQRAYREQVRRHHPDASDHPDARERVKEINRAREVLADPEERERYDRLGHRAYVHQVGRAPPSTPAGNAADGAGGTAAETGDGARQPDDGAGGEGPFDSRYAGGETAPASERAGAGGADRPAVEGRTRTGKPFAFREFVSAVLLAGPVGAALVVASAYLRVAPATRPVDGSVVFVLLWAGVAVLAGELAAGGARVLPEAPARAYALPAALVAAAWFLRADAPAVAAALGLYGAYAALFRASAAAGRERPAIAPAAVWFVGTVAPALAVYDRLFPVGGLGRDVGREAVSLVASAGPPLSAAVASPLSLAVALPLAVGLSHALLVGLGRPLVSLLGRLRARIGTGSHPPSGGPG